MTSRGNLGEIVYEKLRQDILSGKFSPKDRLNENAIAEIYKVSRTPVREALQRLAKEGLVVKKEDGYYVTYLTKEDILKVFEARIALETYVVAKLASFKDSEKLKKIEELVSELDKIKNDTSKLKEIEELVNKIHLELTKVTDNKFIYEFVEELISRLVVVRIASAIVSEMRISITERLKRILEAIKEGNSDKARDEMKKYLEELMDYIKKTVRIV